MHPTLEANCEAFVQCRSRSHVFYGSGSLQVNGLGETEAETAIDGEDDIFISVSISIFRGGARSRAGRGVSLFAGAAFGENAGGLDGDRLTSDVQTHQHDPQIAGIERMPGAPRFEDVSGRGRAAGDQGLAVDGDRVVEGGAKVSPAWDAALESGLRRRMEMGVPSGSFVADGISDWLGEMPFKRGGRSKGSFCEPAGFAALSAGGRLQAQRTMSASRTINIGTIDIGTINIWTIDVGTIDMRYVSGLNDIGDILRRAGCGLAPGRKIVIELSNRQSRGSSHRRAELLPGV